MQMATSGSSERAQREPISRLERDYNMATRDSRSGGSGRSRRRGSRGPLRKKGAPRRPAQSSSARDEKRGQNLVRLNKFLADNGVASRRGSDELIESLRQSKLQAPPETK